jgi:hypothetical protein
MTTGRQEAAMKRLDEADTEALHWTRTHTSLRESVYMLCDDSEDGGSIAIVRWGGEPTVVETADGRWFLTQRGLWIQRVVVEPETAADGVGAFSVRRDWLHRWWLTRADGARLHWRWAGLATLNWVCQDAAGDQLAYVTVTEQHSQRGVDNPLEVEGQVALAACMARWSEAAFILSVGWYVMLVARLYSHSSPGGG